MRPDEVHRDAVEAAHAWRDEERGKRPRPASPRKLTGAELKEHRQPGAPKPGDRIQIRWPNGPRNFEMHFERLDEVMPTPHPGWFWLHGSVGSEYLERWGATFHEYRTLYARFVSDGVYEMVPCGGKLSDLPPLT